MRTVSLCLETIKERDGDVKAWVEVNPQPALASGPLDGVPFGVKDIFETAGLKTEWGTPLFKGRIGQKDAPLVARLRRLGAVMLGKTATTAFAYFDPAETRNPRNLRCTPGGSSSGSAAAIAAGMAEFTLGSQTQGSVLRPASYCGVVGFKPSYGLLEVEGVMPFTPSFDTVGLFTQTAAAMRKLWGAMGYQTGRGFGRMMAWEPPAEVEPAMRHAFVETVRRMGVEMAPRPAVVDRIIGAASLVNDYEGALTNEARYREFGARIGVKLSELIERGLAVKPEDYQAALREIKRAEVFGGFDVVLTPAALGAAPEGLASTGSPRMNGYWTALGCPAISIPMKVDGMPLGLQMTARPGADAMLLETACVVENEWG